jgi:hypothetical protein
MAIDIVRTLKIENPAEGGSETDFGPTEMSVTADYAAMKGVSFEGSTGFRVEKIGRAIVSLQPDGSQKPFYDSNGSVTAIEFYNSVSSQVNANRVARQVVSYDTNFSPTSQLSIIYEADGTTIARSTTAVFSYTSYDLTNITDSTTGNL